MSNYYRSFVAIALAAFSVPTAFAHDPTQDKLKSVDEIPSKKALREAGMTVSPLDALPGHALILIDYTLSPPVIRLIQDKWYQKGQVSTFRPGTPIRLSPGRKLAIAALVDDKAVKVSDESKVTVQHVESDTRTSYGLRERQLQDWGKYSPSTERNSKKLVWTSCGSLVTFVHEEELAVPHTGTLTIHFDPSGKSKKVSFDTVKPYDEFEHNVMIVVTAAERWQFDDTFSPYLTISSKQRPKFAAATTPIVFGNNGRIRLDAVAAFDTAGNESFLGQALSYSMYLGTTYKETGRGFFRFPVRVTLSIGFQGWSFDNKAFGNGRPFLGFGISIPAGNAG